MRELGQGAFGQASSHGFYVDVQVTSGCYCMALLCEDTLLP